MIQQRAERKEGLNTQTKQGQVQPIDEGGGQSEGEADWIIENMRWKTQCRKTHYDSSKTQLKWKVLTLMYKNMQ